MSESPVPGPDTPIWTRAEIVDLIHDGLPIIEAYDTSIVAPRRFAEEIAAELLARDVDVAVNSDQADTAVSTRRGSELNSDPNRCAKCGCDRASGSTCPTPPCGLDDQGDGDLLGAVANLLDLPARNDDGVSLSWGDVIRRLQEWRGDIKHRERLRALGAEQSRPALTPEYRVWWTDESGVEPGVEPGVTRLSNTPYPGMFRDWVKSIEGIVRAVEVREATPWRDLDEAPASALANTETTKGDDDA